MVTLKSILSVWGKARTAAAAAFDALDQSRDAVAEARDRIATVEAAPLPLDEAVAAFTAWLDRTATAAIGNLHLRHFSEPGCEGYRLPSLLLPGEVSPNMQPATEILLGLVGLIGRDALVKTARDQIEHSLLGKETMTASTRAKRLNEAHADLLSAELLEEQIVREMEREGISIARRPDVSAVVLLAADSAFPG